MLPAELPSWNSTVHCSLIRTLRIPAQKEPAWIPLTQHFPNLIKHETAHPHPPPRQPHGPFTNIPINFSFGSWARYIAKMITETVQSFSVLGKNHAVPCYGCWFTGWQAQISITWLFCDSGRTLTHICPSKVGYHPFAQNFYIENSVIQEILN